MIHNRSINVVSALPNTRTRDGDMHSASLLFQNVASDGFARMKIKNTSSDKEMPVQFFVSHNVKCYLKSYEGTTYIDEGTAVSIWNRRVGVTRTELAEIKHTPTIDVLGALRLDQLFPGSTSGSKLGGTGSGLATYIPPGLEILIELQNKSLQAEDFSLVFDWFEQDVDLKYSDNI